MEKVRWEIKYVFPKTHLYDKLYLFSYSVLLIKYFLILLVVNPLSCESISVTSIADTPETQNSTHFAIQSTFEIQDIKLAPK